MTKDQAAAQRLKWEQQMLSANNWLAGENCRLRVRRGRYKGFEVFDPEHEPDRMQIGGFTSVFDAFGACLLVTRIAQEKVAPNSKISSG